ncbi:anthranilate synthase family protein [Nonomuraea typhae]|uniref:anthranilate synthase n=1 Tax=Nonomuraea typhae TaxID=2603600 RepID=A0ABW7YQ34_9ACTN
MDGTHLLDRLTAADPPPFALLSRAGRNGIEVLVGTMSEIRSLAGLPPGQGPGPHALVLLPYCQIGERGFACRDDGEPIRVLSITEHGTVGRATALRYLPDDPVLMKGGGFDLDDGAYASIVRRVVEDEIGAGEGSNFVIKRDYVSTITGYSPAAALTLFRRLLSTETGAYWTFVVCTGTRTFIGATPERHVSLDAGRLVMNPISGTYRYPSGGPDLPGVLRFLNDAKEADELFMVVDEELKMMARLCPAGGRVMGPYLKEMAHLAHTEYLIEGRTTAGVTDILRETMFAPTVTGSPLENACRVLSRHEPKGRGYYAGVIALVGEDEAGDARLDSSILIRTADIHPSGELRIGVGSTLVRQSDPASEAEETRSKAAGLLHALNGIQRPATAAAAGTLGRHPKVESALASRNAGLSAHWLADPARRAVADPRLTGLKALVVDAEDTFTAMLRCHLVALGLNVRIEAYDEVDVPDLAGADVVVLGPGPGDPRDEADPKTARLRRLAQACVEEEIPLLAVCLSHQIVSGLLGLDLVRKPVPSQGEQRWIDLFGVREQVGFYSTFAARCDVDAWESAWAGPIEVSRDRVSGEVFALRGACFASVQFHPESLLTRKGSAILAGLLRGLLKETTFGHPKTKK